VAVLGVNTYAASTCYSMTDGNASAGTWYLPADDELTAVFQLIDSNAFDPMMNQNFYWTSTESSLNPPLLANVFVHTYSVTSAIGKVELRSIPLHPRFLKARRGVTRGPHKLPAALKYQSNPALRSPPCGLKIRRP